MFPDSVYQIYGHISPAEMEKLFNLAAAVPQNGVIVEIGSFQGKSTICLGLGAKESGAQVYAIDPHEDCQPNESTHYGMENHAALLKNLVEFEVADVVRVIALESMSALFSWTKLIDLLWIDGSHLYDDVSNDLILWSKFVTQSGKIALHDSTGHYPDVSKVLNNFLVINLWEIVQQIDGTTILGRANV